MRPYSGPRQRRLPPRCRPTRQAMPNSPGSCKGSAMRHRLRFRAASSGRSARRRGLRAGAHCQRRRRHRSLALCHLQRRPAPPHRLGATARINAAEAGLDRLGAKARVQIVWILAGAGIAGVLIGPLGLCLLRRVLKRIGAVGAALARLARNDTSVEIPRSCEVGRDWRIRPRSPCSRPSRSRYCTSRPSWNGSTCNSTLPLTTCRSALACSTRKSACSCATRVTPRCIGCRAN